MRLDCILPSLHVNQSLIAEDCGEARYPSIYIIGFVKKALENCQGLGDGLVEAHSLSRITREERLIEFIDGTVLSFRVRSSDRCREEIVLRPLKISSRLCCDPVSQTHAKTWVLEQV